MRKVSRYLVRYLKQASLDRTEFTRDSGGNSQASDPTLILDDSVTSIRAIPHVSSQRQPDIDRLALFAILKKAQVSFGIAPARHAQGKCSEMTANDWPCHEFHRREIALTFRIVQISERSVYLVIIKFSKSIASTRSSLGRANSPVTVSLIQRPIASITSYCVELLVTAAAKSSQSLLA